MKTPHQVRNANRNHPRLIDLATRTGDSMSLDRATMSSTQLYQLAAQEEIPLSEDEKDRVSPDYLFVLALTNRLGLSQRDKNRLRPLHLANLAVAKKVDLSDQDKGRLPTELLFEMFVQGFVDLSEGEMARFTAAQLQHLKRLKELQDSYAQAPCSHEDRDGSQTGTLPRIVMDVPLKKFFGWPRPQNTRRVHPARLRPRNTPRTRIRVTLEIHNKLKSFGPRLPSDRIDGTATSH